MFWKKRPRLNAELLLKRQVPILSKDEARSWLGGTPKVPTGTPWPRNSKGEPLQFIAQVACEDLPNTLWNALGPRSGSLLLFANVLNLDRISQKDEVQVVHVDATGPETEPPDDCPVARFAMLISPLTGQNISHPGIPKLWRKWPVDFVLHEYEDTGDPTKKPYPLYRCAEEIFGAPVSDRGIVAKDFGIEQPMTLRGALYVIEGILNAVGTPEKFKRDFVGMKLGLLDDPPEPDQQGFNEEFERRRNANPNLADGDWSASGAARAALNSEMKAERRSGWLARARPALVRDIEKWQQLHAAEAKELDAVRYTLDDKEISRKQFNLNHRAERVKGMEQDLLYLDDLLKAYPGLEGEKELSAGFKELGEAYLERGNHMIRQLNELKACMAGRDLDTSLSSEDWKEITRIWTDISGPVWQKREGKLVQKVELEFQVQRFIEAAIREDLLDLYTGDNAADVRLEHAHIADLEAKVRYLGRGARHQIGGQRIPLQTELCHDPDRAVLFQISSDASLGWVWGDMGTLYVTISNSDLDASQFGNLHSWLEYY